MKSLEGIFSDNSDNLAEDETNNTEVDDEQDSTDDFMKSLEGMFLD
jgi:hypothetical protein